MTSSSSGSTGGRETSFGVARAACCSSSASSERAVSATATTGLASGSSGSSSAADATGESTSDEGSTGTTGEPACTKNVVLMGYWPPTNEMLRPWSTDPAQNPGGWIGEDWEGYGYDVYSFFPEFPPDGDPTNDSIGDDGASVTVEPDESSVTVEVPEE